MKRMKNNQEVSRLHGQNSLDSSFHHDKKCCMMTQSVPKTHGCCCDKVATDGGYAAEKMNKSECSDTAHDDAGCTCGELAVTAAKSKIISFKNIALVLGVVLWIVALFTQSGIWWIALLQFLPSYVLIGYEMLIRCGKNMLHGKFFDENLLMVIASFGAFALQDNVEAVAVVIFFAVGERFNDFAVSRSASRIRSALQLLPDTVRVMTDNGVAICNANQLTVGDVVQLQAGDRVPTDCILQSEQCYLDTSSLTGESMPRLVSRGEEMLSGSINTQQVVLATVQCLPSKSTAAKIMDLVQDATKHKAKAETLLTRFASVYTPIVVGMAVFVAFLLPIMVGGIYSAFFAVALNFLIVSCPCALLINVPLSYFAGLGAASRVGAVIKGSNYLAVLANVSCVLFDKTGTLTNGKFVVQQVQASEAMSKEELSTLIASVEEYSKHPIATAIATAFVPRLESGAVTNCKEVAGGGMFALVRGEPIVIGNAEFLRKQGIAVEANDSIYTTVHAARSQIYLGSITLADMPKNDAVAGLELLKKAGVKQVVMLTGDRLQVAEQVAKQLHITKVHAELLPQNKLNLVQQYAKSFRGRVAFVGDGINDVLSLAAADIGIACGGSQACLESADIALLSDRLTPIALAKNIANKTKRIIVQNLVFALAVKLLIMAMGFFVVLPLFVAVLGDVGCALITILNATRAGRLTKESRKHLVATT